ncbi:MAG: CrcB family protein [Candidatus Nanopelagicales bacterium]|jgi:CrcB protein
MAAWVAVILGAAIGAPTRFAVDRFMIRRRGTSWPYGTFVVNLSGSLILGFVTGLSLTFAAAGATPWHYASTLIGTGFCGALTTFSGWTSQIYDLSRRPLRWTGTMYALLSVVLGLALASGGYALGSIIG